MQNLKCKIKTANIKVFFPFILFLYNNILYPQSVNLPLSHWSYNFLERMEAKGVYHSLLTRSKPYNREDVKNIIIEIEKNRDKLTKVEISELERLKGDFLYELSSEIKIDSSQYNSKFKKTLNYIKSRFFDNEKKHWLIWQENESFFFADPIVSQIFDSGNFKKNKIISFTSGGVSVYGNIKGSLSFYADVKNTLIRGANLESNFDVSKGLPIVQDNTNAYQDQQIVYFIPKIPWFRFQIGRDNLVWGPGYRGQLTISDNMPVLDFFEFEFSYKRFRYISLSGFLRSNIGQKNIGAHRFELMIFPGLYFSTGETVVYGNRGLEFEYVNPLMAYHIAQHHLGDKDNKTMFLDFTADIIPKYRFYGEIFVDDLSFGKLFTGWWGNKWAIILGTWIIEPIGLKDSDFRIEYTRIEPYVYTHRDSINTYQHYNRIIGHWLGPDADNFFMELNYRFSLNFSVAINFERTRYGAKNDLKFNLPASGEEFSKKFLSGIVESNLNYGAKLSYQFMRDVFLKAEYKINFVKNYKHTKNKNFRENKFKIEVSYNY
jgi:hypothetical protein